ncbi:MAG: hypothetical protein ACI4TX_03380, partial [Christensenellales bacterium]
MFLSMKDLVIYEMQGMIGDISNIDNDYINRRIDAVKTNALEYEDSVISIDVSNICGGEFESAINSLPKIYVEKKGGDEKYQSIYEDRHKFLKSIADYHIEEADFDNQVKSVINIINQIGQY